MAYTKFLGKSVPQGAAAHIFLAASPDVKSISGGYWVDCRQEEYWVRSGSACLAPEMTGTDGGPSRQRLTRKPPVHFFSQQHYALVRNPKLGAELWAKSAKLTGHHGEI